MESAMKRLMMDLEEFNIRTAKNRRREAKWQRTWLLAQSGLFYVIGTYFLVIPLFGGTWWYILSVVIYWGGATWWLWFGIPRWRRAHMKATRDMVIAMRNLRRLNEE